MADLEELRRQAAAGDAHAACVLGESYLHGNKGAEVDLEKAFLWSEKAAPLKRKRVSSSSAGVTVIL